MLTVQFADYNTNFSNVGSLDGVNRKSSVYVRTKPVEINFDGVNNCQYLENGKTWVSTDNQGLNIEHRGLDIYAHPAPGTTGVLS